MIKELTTRIAPSQREFFKQIQANLIEGKIYDIKLRGDCVDCSINFLFNSKGNNKATGFYETLSTERNQEVNKLEIQVGDLEKKVAELKSKLEKSKKASLKTSAKLASKTRSETRQKTAIDRLRKRNIQLGDENRILKRAKKEDLLPVTSAQVKTRIQAMKLTQQELADEMSMPLNRVSTALNNPARYKTTFNEIVRYLEMEE